LIIIHIEILSGQQGGFYIQNQTEIWMGYKWILEWACFIMFWFGFCVRL